MMGTREFLGMRPRVSPRNLPENAASYARDCWLSKGYPVAAPKLATVSNAPTGQFVSGVKTIFRYDGDGSTAKPYRFFEWSEDVDVVRMPTVSQSVLKRVAWSGDDYPRHTHETIIGDTFNSPGKPISRRLGIPAPTAAPAVSLVTTGFEADDTKIAEANAYVYTFVSDLYEEGPPSLPSNDVTRFYNADGDIQSVKITMRTSAPYPNDGGDSGVVRKRIYRTLTGASGVTSWQMVAEVSLATSSYTDSKHNTELGLGLVSTLWDAPPAGLSGLTLMPNGVMAGFLGTDIYLSVPYQPHAWPTDYIVNVGSQVVGMDAIGVTLVVGTVDAPYLISGLDPATASPSRMEFQQVCASKRSFAAMDQMGIAYASEEGLVLVAPGGGRFLSNELYDKESWQALEPATFKSVYHDGSYVAFNDEKAIAINPENTGAIEFSDVGVKVVYQDLELDRIWVIDHDRRLREWRTTVVESDALREMTWKSKLHAYTSRAYSSAQVIAETYPGDGGGEIHFLMFGDGGTQVLDIKVFSDNPFRLPATIGLNREYTYEVRGKANILEVRIGSMKEMI